MVTEQDFFRQLKLDEQAFRYKRQATTKEIERHYRRLLVRLLLAAGCESIYCCPANDHVDLLVDGHAVEVKISTARTRTNPQRAEFYQFLLHNHAHRHHLNGDLLICLCVTPDRDLCPFVIPTPAVGDRRTVEITSDPWAYAGQWAPYRAAYHLLQQQPAPIDTTCQNVVS